MEIELDRRIWRQATHGSCESGGFARPDWYGLQARLRAAREAGRAFVASGSAGSAASRGSFDGPAAHRIVAFGQASTFVNPTDSANRKAGGVKEAVVADDIMIGDRG